MNRLSEYKDWKTKTQVEKLLKNAVEGEPILSNDIKDGDVFIQNNGWVGEMVDNQRGNTRIANIHGFCTEAGSIYVWDIVQVAKDGVLRSIKLTPKQEKDKKRTEQIMSDIF